MEARSIKTHPFYPKIIDETSPIIVQKYGGTSLGTVERIHLVAQRISDLAKLGYKRTAIVLSAMSGETNRLVSLVEQVNPKASALAFDFAVSSGEQVSVGLMVAALEKLGLRAKPFAGFQLGIRTNGSHSSARIENINTDLLHKSWQNNMIPVIAGYQGMSLDNEITTLGRGGTDTSAVAIAAALGADLCEINTDVDGFFSADPRIVPTAKLMEEMSYELALEMAILGSKVLHHRCVELAAKFNLPLVTRNTFKSEESARTLMTDWNHKQTLEAAVVSGVAVEKKIARFSVKSDENNEDFLPHVFSALSEAGINVDVIVHDHRASQGAQVAFTCSSAEHQTCRDTLSKTSCLISKKPLSIESESELAKVSIVGIGMISHHGVARRMFKTLADNGISIHMVSTSEIKVTCVVAEKDSDLAVQKLHAEFLET